jgi:UDP-glucose 4-epimerase
MKRAIVTGGAGFIGSHLVDLLVHEGLQVKVIDDLATGRRANLAHHEGNPAVQFHFHDVADADAIAPLFSGCEWVFHLAGLADIVPSIEQPLRYHRANVSGTVAVLEAARSAGAKRFLYAASSSCYGLSDRFPTSEAEPVRPQYPYALTKWLGEECVMHWARVYKLPAVSLRLFNVYGPRSRTTGAYGAVFGVFLAQKLAGKPFTVVGDGTQTRDFTFVTDVAEAFLAAARSEETAEIFNVGSGHTYPVNRLVELLEGPVVHIPKRPGEPECTFADTARIRRLLGWEPRVPFEEGVRRMLDNIDLWKDAPVWDEASIAVATRAWFENLGNVRESTAAPQRP